MRADAELKHSLAVTVPKFEGEGYTMHTIRIKYEWTPPRCSSCKVFGHVLNECPKKLNTHAIKNMKAPRQAIRGVQIVSRTKFTYQPKAPRKPKVTNDNNYTTVPSISNSFDVLSSISDVEEGEGNKASAFGSLNTTSQAARINEIES